MKPRKQQRTPYQWQSFAKGLLVYACLVHKAAAFSQSPRPRPSSFLSASSTALSRPLISSNTLGTCHHRRPMAISSILHSSVSNNNEEQPSSPRSKLRQLTGFSLTAFRTTLRTATGFSLTAFRTTLRTLTGISLSQTISGTMRRILEILHPGLRYFLQPLLIMYYAPLLMIRYWMVGPSQAYVEESRSGHEKVVEGWRRAVEVAEKANLGGYWPVHLNEDGTITTSLPPDPSDVLDLADGIEKSVAMATTAVESSSSDYQI
mmetsp:Transcript_22914/g.48299  ORF Transcript_22914/g.48299 Transcript_22914/m.48299 type:complete len:262 (-) Transcript_22914:131-916(-)